MLERKPEVLPEASGFSSQMLMKHLNKIQNSSNYNRSINWSSIEKCLELYNEAHDKSLDWLIKSWDQDDEDDRVICKAYYRKAVKERARLANELYKMTEIWRRYDTT